MSNYVWMALIVLALTLVGILTLGSITIRYYWGDRGTPPPSVEERRRLRREELRARQNAQAAREKKRL